MSSSSSSNEEERDIDVVVLVVLTDDVLLEIFSFLPADILIQFKIVCKSWFNLITSNIRNPKFIEMHTNHHSSHATITTTTIDYLPTILCTSTSTQPIPYHNLYSLNYSTTNSTSSSSSSFDNKKKKIEAIDVVYPLKSPSSKVFILGSCNGLLCILVVDYTSKRKTSTIVLCLWNPTTTEFKQVPAAAAAHGHGHQVRVIGVRYGFGFDPFIKDYKVVKLVRLSHDVIIKVYIYTLGTNSWKRVSVENKMIAYNLLRETSRMDLGLYVDGALHWRLDTGIYSFNIPDEEFGEVPKPECSKKVMFGATLQVLRGCLCMSSSYVDHPNRVFQVWMMMHYGVKESWTKLFSVNIDLGWARTGSWENLKPLWICINGEVVIGSEGTHCSSTHLVIYDPNNNKIIESIGVQGIPLNRTREMVHIRSFVSLKSGTYVDQEQSKKKNNKKKGINHLGIA